MVNAAKPARKVRIQHGQDHSVQHLTPYKVIAIILLIVIAFLFTFPLYWIITGSFKDAKTINSATPQWFPLSPTVDNYQRLFTRPALQWLFNTVAICAGSMALTCLCAAMGGYALAKKRFTGRTVIFSIFVCAMALPKQVILIPLLREMAWLNMHNTLWAVIFPTVGWPFGVFLMKQFSETIPNELLEAARIDGAGEARTFTQIVLPLIKPGIGALAIFTFITAWNDYFLQLIMLNDTRVLTISLGIAKLQSELSTDFGLIMAGAAIGSVPIIVIFLIFQKFFTRGITMGAVKG
jgi:multiple sugar transport system permease protein